MGSLALDDAVRWVRRQVEEGPLPSAVFGVATSAGTQHVEAFSGRDARPAQVDDHYALFSVSKPLSGIALARSVERGEVSLRASLASVFPDAGGSDAGGGAGADAGGSGGSDAGGAGADGSDAAGAAGSAPAQPWRAGVRLEHLLSHTAGLSEPPLDSPRDLDELLELARPDFLPGSMNRYSNIAFHGAARILAAATGRDLHDEIESLGSGLTFDPASDPHEVFGQREVGFDYSAMARHRHPAAGVNGTAGALLELGSSLLRAHGGARGQVLHSETLRGMLLPRTVGLPEPVPSDPRRDFGLAWNIRQDSSALLHRNAYGHEGWSGTQWWIYPELDLCFVLMTNLLDVRLHGADPDDLNNAVVAAT